MDVVRKSSIISISFYVDTLFLFYFMSASRNSTVNVYIIASYFPLWKVTAILVSIVES